MSSFYELFVEDIYYTCVAHRKTQIGSILSLSLWLPVIKVQNIRRMSYIFSILTRTLESEKTGIEVVHKIVFYGCIQ